MSKLPYGEFEPGDQLAGVGLRVGCGLHRTPSVVHLGLHVVKAAGGDGVGAGEQSWPGEGHEPSKSKNTESHIRAVAGWMVASSGNRGKQERAAMSVRAAS